MNIIIFSKNRASQLDLLLRSMKKYFKEYDNFKKYVLYTYTDKKFMDGYDITFTKHPEINYVKEKSFKNDLLFLINKDDELSVFFVDDNVFKEPFSINDKEFKIFKNSKDIACLSLRLHPNLTYCYPARVFMKKPTMVKGNIFDWRRKDGDFGYPMSLDGHIFFTSDIISRFEQINYNNPNTLEGILSNIPIPKPLMIMYDKSRIMNLPLNKVQNVNNNVFGHISADFINEQFLQGKRISMENIDGFENTSCHQEIDIKFI